MQPARLADLFELLAQPPHPLADHPAIGLDLGFTRTAEEAEATALAFKVGPAAHEAALLVIEMCELDLQPAFGSRRTLAEYLEDQSGPVDDLAGELFFQIALLDRAQRAVHDDKLGLVLLAGDADIVDLPRPEQQVRAHFAHRQHEAVGNGNADRQRQPLGFGKPRLRVEIIGHPADVRAHHQCPRPARNLAHQVIVEAQFSSSSHSSVRSTGVAGWMVDTACL